MTLPVISASRIKTYKTCAKQYYYKYILPRSDRPKDEKNVGALLGLSLHKAIEQRYRDDANAIQVFQDTMLNTLDEWEEKGYKVNGTEWFSKSFNEGKKILRKFDWTIFDPIQLELEFNLMFPNPAAPIAVINGYIDLITSDGRVVDHKSQRDKPTQDQLNHDAQFVLYAWAYKQIYGSLPQATIWNHLRTNKLMIADVTTDFDFKLEQLTYDINAMLHADHFPRRQMDEVCTRKCAFFEHCYGLRAKHQIEEEDE